jgi:hypothetical protein
MGEDADNASSLSVGVTVDTYTYHSSVGIESVYANTNSIGASIVFETPHSTIN